MVRFAHPGTRTLAGFSHGCSAHCRRSKHMTVMKSDCQPARAADGSSARRFRTWFAGRTRRAERAQNNPLAQGGMLGKI